MNINFVSQLISLMSWLIPLECKVIRIANERNTLRGKQGKQDGRVILEMIDRG